MSEEKHTMTDDPIETILKERGDKYGPYDVCCQMSQGIREVFRTSPQWGDLSSVTKDTLDQIALKMSRVLSGDEKFEDNWRDIVGYAKLALNHHNHHTKMPQSLQCSRCGTHFGEPHRGDCDGTWINPLGSRTSVPTIEEGKNCPDCGVGFMEFHEHDCPKVTNIMKGSRNNG